MTFHVVTDGFKAQSLLTCGRQGCLYVIFCCQKREGPEDMGATAVYELDTEHDRDAQAVFQRSLDVRIKIYLH